MNPIVIEYIIDERRMAVRREIRRRQLIAAHSVGRPTRRRRLLLAVARMLIHLGERLKCRYGVEERLPAG